MSWFSSAAVAPSVLELEGTSLGANLESVMVSGAVLEKGGEGRSIRSMK